MQHSAQTSSSWRSVGTTVGSNPVSNVLPAQVTQPLQSGAQHVVRPQSSASCVLRHIGAETAMSKSGILSPEEHRWATHCYQRTAPQGQELPSWITNRLKDIPVAIIDGATAAPVPNGSSAPSASLPVVQETGGSPRSDTFQDPHPNTSLDELRWAYYQTAPKNQNHLSVAACAIPLAGGPPAGNSALSASSAAPPQTPIFPTPVRALFPPTPILQAGDAAAVPGCQQLQKGCMDTSDALDVEQHFQCIYVLPANSIASPEEMRVVQVESYKVGKQIMPYWLVSGR
ncbi:hypothetical protein Vretimale_18426 [Volvox reticuliferus]|uniref:Uncharacterized protein n=1 Tax=Volvox reticuliferus TaxID=1737510 RepID=A0A8J4GX45_9CHLO|nr:hypothetical protein Vretifemale_19157 [Volvox reticuliferus]GIM15678.1 hypothetical protein Vretimale_18426 [Volvox reticuliferus]